MGTPFGRKQGFCKSCVEGLAFSEQLPGIGYVAADLGEERWEVPLSESAFGCFDSI